MIDYISQSPIIPIIFSGLLVIIILMQCLTRRRISYPKLLFSLFLAFGSAMLFVFFQEIKAAGDVVLIITYFGMLAIEAAVFVILFISLDLSFASERFRKTLTKSLDENKLYVILDRKDKIKEISSCFLNDLGISNHEAIGKNFFDVIELKYRLVALNGNSAFKKDIKAFYDHYERKVKPDDKKELELEVQDDNASLIAFYFNEDVIFANDKYRGRILIGDKKSEETLMGLEKKEFAAKSELNSIKDKFQVILDKTTDGLFFNTLPEDSLWVNDVLVEKLHLNSNSLTSTEFYNRVSPRDQKLYSEALGQAATGDETDYRIAYDFNVGSGFVHIIENGCRIPSGNSFELCGVMNVFDDDGFEKSGTPLDDIKSEKKLRELLQKLDKESRVYEIAYLKLDTIPQINEKYGRMVGNYCISEFVTRFKNEYTPDGNIYRISGLEFVAVILDFSKIEALKSALRHGEKPLHLVMNYGDEKVKIDSSLGICMSKSAPNYEEVVKGARSACKYASNPQFMASYCDYEDMR